MFINGCKIADVKSMLIQLFSDDAPITQAALREKVEEGTISVAEQGGFIKSVVLNGEICYQIRKEGKTYRDK